jgi:hypothetical protein
MWDRELNTIIFFANLLFAQMFSFSIFFRQNYTDKTRLQQDKKIAEEFI